MKVAWSTEAVFRFCVALLASFYFFSVAGTPADWHFLDNIDLIIHEAGHVVFLPFGQFLDILGGSLFQILVPAVFVGYFALKNQWYAAFLLLFWVGENLINVSVYAGDSIVMQLPMLGGDSGIHDWNYVLTALGILRFTPVVASVIYMLGIFTILSAAVGSLFFANENLLRMLNDLRTYDGEETQGSSGSVRESVGQQ